VAVDLTCDRRAGCLGEVATTGIGVAVGDDSVLVGREAVLGELRAMVESAEAGHGGLVLMGGEPGIGKTRLVEVVAAEAEARGDEVVWASCWHGQGAPPYWPWARLLRALLVADTHQAIADRGLAQLGRLVPDLIPPIAVERAVSLAPDDERALLFVAVSAFLTDVPKRGATTLLVLDDLHWADLPSLYLLGFLARELRAAPVLVVGTYRDAEVGPSHPLSPILADLPGNTRRVSLSGLTETAVAQLLTVSLDERPSPELIAAVHRRTGGNPLFVHELARQLRADASPRGGAGAEDAPLVLPEAIRDVLQRRLGTLSRAAGQLVAAAAVLGDEFELGVLEHVIDASPADFFGLLDEAIGARILTLARQAGGRHRFIHGLFREAALENLGIRQQAELHRAAALAIETLHQQELRPHLAELASHFVQALSTGTVEQAIRYCRLSGEAARSVFAWEEAASQLQTALELMEAHGALAAERADLNLRLGELMSLASFGPARLAYHQQALALYREAGDVGGVAKAHGKLGSALSTYPDLMDIPSAMAHFKAAEAILCVQEPQASLAYVYAGLATAAFYGMNIVEGTLAASKAAELGERIPHRPVWATGSGMLGQHLILAGRIAEGIELITRAWATADEIDHPAAAFGTTWMVASGLTFLADPVAARGWCERELAKPRSAHVQTQRAYLLTFSAIAHILSGHLADARRLVDEAAGHEATRLVVPLLEMWGGDKERAVALFCAHRDRSADSGNRWDEWRDSYWLGRLQARTGDAEQAERHLRGALALAVDAPTVLVEVATRTELALLLTDAGSLEEASAQLDRVGALVVGGEDWRGLGGRARLAAAMGLSAEGHVDASEAAFAEAIETFRRYQLPWDEAEVLCRWADQLERRGREADAKPKRAAGLHSYYHLGAGPSWSETVSNSVSGSRHRGTSPVAGAVAAESCFEREGEYWTLCYGATVARLRDTKGLRHLAHLLARPGREVHALELDGVPASRDALEGARAGEAGLVPSLGDGDAGSILDPQAKAAYRRRLADLQEDLDEAKMFNDGERAARAQTEIDFLAQELAAAVGLGGRDRRASSAAERARVRVTLAIRSAMSRIDEAHPALGAHLVETVRTGLYCSYRPDSRVPITWRTSASVG
jgi:tetratricopeptide (TPR) repeat protein